MYIVNFSSFCSASTAPPFDVNMELRLNFHNSKREDAAQAHHIFLHMLILSLAAQ